MIFQISKLHVAVLVVGAEPSVFNIPCRPVPQFPVDEAIRLREPLINVRDGHWGAKEVHVCTGLICCRKQYLITKGLAACPQSLLCAALPHRAAHQVAFVSTLVLSCCHLLVFYSRFLTWFLECFNGPAK